MPQWVSFFEYFECLSPSLSGRLLVWSQCNTLSCSASAACLQCAILIAATRARHARIKLQHFDKVHKFLQSYKAREALTKRTSHWVMQITSASGYSATSQSWQTPWNLIAKLPHFMWNVFKHQFIKSQEREISKRQVETDFQPIRIFYTFSTFSSSGGGPQMYSITDVSRGLKRSAGYSVKPLSSTNSDKSRDRKSVV